MAEWVCYGFTDSGFPDGMVEIIKHYLVENRAEQPSVLVYRVSPAIGLGVVTLTLIKAGTELDPYSGAIRPVELASDESIQSDKTVVNVSLENF